MKKASSQNFLCLLTGYKIFFDQKEIKRIGLSVQRSVVGQFSFNGKKVQSAHVKGEECLVSRDGQKKSQTRFGKLMAKRSAKN